MRLTGIKLTVNYPETEVEVAISSEMTPLELSRVILDLDRTEPEMASFVLVAAVKREGWAP